jgi:hypothetical protein
MPHKNADEIKIVCPVCGCFCIGIQGGVWIENQIRFPCHSKKCRGKNRYVNAALLEKIVDSADIPDIVVIRKFSAVS